MKTAVLFGSSGLIGSNLLDNLINNNTYNKIKIFVRKLPSIDNSKVEVINTDFLDLDKGDVTEDADLIIQNLAEKGIKDIAVIAPAFSSDCLETLEEINGEIRESFLNAGGHNFTYIPCLNDQPVHLKAIFKIVKTQLSGWL